MGKNTIAALSTAAILAGCGTNQCQQNQEINLNIEQTKKGTDIVNFGIKGEDPDGLKSVTYIVTDENGNTIKNQESNLSGTTYTNNIEITQLQDGSKYKVTVTLTGTNICGEDENVTKTIFVETLGIDSKVKVETKINTINNDELNISYNISDADGINEAVLVVYDIEGNLLKQKNLNKTDIQEKTNTNLVTSLSGNEIVKLEDGDYYNFIVKSKNGQTGEIEQTESQKIYYESNQEEEIEFSSNEIKYELEKFDSNDEEIKYSIIGAQNNFLLEDNILILNNKENLPNELYILKETSNGEKKIEKFIINFEESESYYIPPTTYVEPETSTTNEDNTDNNTSNENNNTIEETNLAPILVDQNISINQDTSTDISLNAIDLDGDSLIYSIIEGPENGTIINNQDGIINYTPNDGFVGTEKIIVAVSDGNNTAQATITVNVLDTEAPIITLNPYDLYIEYYNEEGKLVIFKGNGVEYNEPGANAIDNSDNNIQVEIKYYNINLEEVSIKELSNEGEYIVKYIATDSSGNQSIIEKGVIITEGTYE